MGSRVAIIGLLLCSVMVCAIAWAIEPPAPRQPEAPTISTPAVKQTMVETIVSPTGIVVRTFQIEEGQPVQPVQLPVPDMDRCCPQCVLCNHGSKPYKKYTDPDFGPYMAYLDRTVRRNRSLPKEDGGALPVVLSVVVAKDGKLVKVEVLTSSGSETVDAAALKAVELSSPFRPLPTSAREPLKMSITFESDMVKIDRFKEKNVENNDAD